MRIVIRTLLAAVLAHSVLGMSPAVAQQPATPAAPDLTAQFASDPLNTAATYAYILDGDNGQPLYSKRGDEPMIPASMSKLMLYYIVFERIRDGRLKMDEELTVSEHAWRTGGAGTDGSTMFLPLNSKVTVENLLRGAIIVSGNDACIVLAEGIAGSEEGFAREATAKAKELGMTASTFANSTGLDDPGQRMSAHDIAVLAHRIIKDFPQYYPIFSEPTFVWNNITQYNRNPLLKELPGADGVKTGHLAAAGFGLVGSAVRDGKRRIVVLQGLTSETERKKEAPRVMRSAFVDFTSTRLVDKGAEVAVADVWLGARDKVPLVATQDFSTGVHISALKNIKAKVSYTGPLSAPVKEGDIVGRLVISVPGMSNVEIPVAAGASVDKLGLFGRAMLGLKGPETGDPDAPKEAAPKGG